MDCNSRRKRLYELSAAGAIVATLGIIQAVSVPAATKVQRLLVDLGHVPVFAIIAFLFLKFARRADRNGGVYPTHRDYLVIGLGVLALAVVSEGLQMLDARRVVSVSDLLRNGAGGALGLLLCAAYYRPRTDRRARGALLAFALVLLLFLLFPLAWTSLAYWHRLASWPAVLGANHRLELPYTVAYESELQVVRLPNERIRNGRETALRVRVSDCEQCGILVQELNGDWNGLTRLCLELTNPGRAAMRLSVKLGNAPMFFRSSRFHSSEISMPAGSRENHCLPITDAPRAGSPTPAAIEYRSLAVLTGAGESADLVIHGIRLQ